MTYGDYENFDCKNIKVLISVETQRNIFIFKVLNDGKILVNIDYGISVYDLKKCQLNNILDRYELTKEGEGEVLDEDKISEIIQLYDNNFLFKLTEKVKIIQIKEEKIEVIGIFYIEHENIFKFSEEKFMFTNSNKIFFFSYKNGKLLDDNHKIKIKNCYFISQIYKINDCEIIVNGEGKGIFSIIKYLIICNIYSEKKINLVKYKSCEVLEIKLINKNILIYRYDQELFLVNLEQRVIIKKISYFNYMTSLYLLNDKYFLAYNSSRISKYEIEENDIKCKSETKEEFYGLSYIEKYFDNKIIVYDSGYRIFQIIG